MKTFEERFTAWTDDQLEGADLAAFESELAERADAVGERDAARSLGIFLREHGAAPAMTNEDFFNHSLMERIYEELPTKPIADTGAPEPGTWWGLPKMLWYGAACLVAAIVILPLAVPNTPEKTAQREVGPNAVDAPAPAPAIADSGSYMAEVLETTASDPKVSAVAIHTPENDMTVVWVDGLDYIPASNEITAVSRAN